MPLSMYQVAVPAFLQMLQALSANLDKAAAFARETGTDPAELVNGRLAPDMLPLRGQVQIASDSAKGAVARLAQQDIPKFADTESSLEELKERIAKTVNFVRSVEPAAFDGSEEREIVLKIGKMEMRFSGRHYLQHFALPNFYFHVTTAYGILRHKGVPLGKPDFMGSLPPG